MKHKKLALTALALAGSLFCTVAARAGHWMQFESSNQLWSGYVTLPACTVTQFAAYTGAPGGASYNDGPLGYYTTTTSFTVTGSVSAGTYSVYLFVNGYGYSAMTANW